MKYSKQAYLVLLTAVAGISISAMPVAAQLRVDTAGHAMDANTQVGSGGYNSQSANSPLWSQYQNNVVTGNATGGFAFHGKSFNGINLGAGYTDPFAFRGLLPGEGVDQFIANSTGVPTMANPTASSSNYAAGPNPNGIYYGSISHSSAPNGFQANPYGAGYVPQQLPSPQMSSDMRLGTIDYSGSGQIIPKPYEMILPGPVDPTADPATPAQQMLAANPIFGVVNWSMTPANGQQQSQPTPNLGQTPLQQGIAPQIRQGLTIDQLQNLRQQVSNANSNAIGNQPTNSSNNSSSGVTNALPTLGPGATNSTSGQPLGQVNNQSSLVQPTNLSPTAGNVSTDQSSRQYLGSINLPSPSQQSAQYAKLRKSIDDYNSAHSMTDEQANRKFQQILRLRAQANVAAENGANVLTGPGGGAGAAANPAAVPSPEQPISPSVGSTPTKENHLLKPGFNTVPQNMGPGPGMNMPASAAPVPIDSFAKDIPAKGLADLIASGDVEVQHGQYDKAIAAYNQAIDVVPNNPLVLVARSIAELGGGYFAQANSDLHLAISEDPAVLMGQYDLQKQFGDARLKKLIAELKDIADGSQDNTLHAFLLTFCYYNSHHIGQAADWLQTTDRRSGGQDPAIVQMKKYWNFSDEVPAQVLPAAVKPHSSGPANQPAPSK